VSTVNGRTTLVHLSDVHATEDGRLYGSIDGAARLEDLARAVVARGVTPEAVIVSGDLVQRGHPGAYRRVAAAMQRTEDVLGAPVLSVLGNHDTARLAGRALRPGPDRPGAAIRVVTLPSLQIVLLDSSTGRLGRDQLDELTALVAAPAVGGRVVVLHHPPVASTFPQLATAHLADADALAAVVAGTDVRCVLAGHFHHAMAATFAGVPVFVAPAVAYQQVLDVAPGRLAGDGTPGMQLVHITADDVTALPVLGRQTEPVFETAVRPSLAAAP
jgi:3',5'-cyclic-AMP phosphodiesterase